MEIMEMMKYERKEMKQEQMLIKKFRNFKDEEVITGIKKIESIGILVNKSCQNLVA